MRAAIGQVAPDVDPEDLVEGARLRQDLELDSLDFLRVLETIAQQAGVDIPEGAYAEVGHGEGARGLTSPPTADLRAGQSRLFLTSTPPKIAVAATPQHGGVRREVTVAGGLVVVTAEDRQAAEVHPPARRHDHVDPAEKGEGVHRRGPVEVCLAHVERRTAEDGDTLAWRKCCERGAGLRPAQDGDDVRGRSDSGRARRPHPLRFDQQPETRRRMATTGQTSAVDLLPTSS